jgi:hypothetical protein
MSHSQFQSKRFILRRAWLSLWDERMTTGRINQVATVPRHTQALCAKYIRSAYPEAKIHFCKTNFIMHTTSQITYPPIAPHRLVWYRWMDSVPMIHMHNSSKLYKFTHGSPRFSPSKLILSSKLDDTQQQCAHSRTHNTLFNHWSQHYAYRNKASQPVPKFGRVKNLPKHVEFYVLFTHNETVQPKDCFPTSGKNNQTDTLQFVSKKSKSVLSRTLWSSLKLANALYFNILS